MYKVTIENAGQEPLTIHSPTIEGPKLQEGSGNQAINTIDSFNMTLLPNNPGYGKIKPLTTLVRVKNMITGKYEFEGRALAPNDGMDDSGLFELSYECEGEMAYLHDSVQDHVEFRGSPSNLWKKILNVHNARVEEYKQFQLGKVEVTDPNDNVYLYLIPGTSTWETIQEKLVERLGGELRIRKENGVRYIDHLLVAGEEKQTPIKIAKNLKSVTRKVDPTDIITRLYAYGARIESEDENADASEARVTIESVNGGQPYIDGFALIDEFGIQGGSVTYDDVTEPANLLRKAQSDLEGQKKVLTQYTVGALDLSPIDIKYERLDVGNTHPVINPVMSLDENLRIIGKTYNIINVAESGLTIGDKFKDLYDYQVDAEKAARQVASLQATITGQSRRIINLSAELKGVNESVTAINQSLESADLPALNSAVEQLNQAIDSLNEVVGNIPTYSLATSLQDGLMSAADKTKLDLIKTTETVDLDKLGLINITQLVDLDDLVRRVTALEGGTTDGTT